jgi:hypothetical protein
MLLLILFLMLDMLHSWLRSEDHYILGEIMLRRTKGINK